MPIIFAIELLLAFNFICVVSFEEIHYTIIFQLSHLTRLMQE